VKRTTNLKWLFISISLFIAQYSFAQTDFCNGAAPFCTGTTYNFPAPVSGTEAETGPDYGCLGSQPNPVWYYLQIANSGTIVMNISGASAIDDIDFACWGPFNSPTGGCTGGLTADCSDDFLGCGSNTDGFTTYPSGNMTDCSFDGQASEVCTIPNAVTGQYYMVLITNYGGNVTNIIFNQTNSGAGGAGTTNCAIIPCNITNMTATPGPCIAGNTFNVNGTITTTQPPSTGTLTISNSCGGSVTLNPPFSASMNYTVTGSSATGGSCTLTATYSADPTCTYTMTINAPGPCNPASCAISQVTATPGPCIAASNTYNVNGSITFANPPATGTLTVTGSCGGSQIFNAPFASPLTYTLTGLPSNGAACGVTAVFSASVACTNNANYTAPASCSTCTITANNSGDVCVGGLVNLACSPSTPASIPAGTTFSWTGPNSFTSTLQNPTLLNATEAATGIYSVSANFPDGAVCNASTSFTVNPAPTANAGTDVFICPGGSVQLNGQGGTGGTYSWTPAATLDNPNIANPNASPVTTTTYFLTATVNGCSDTDDMTVSVVPSLTGVISGNANICAGQNTQLTSSGGATYSWQPTTGLSNATISNPVASPAVTTDYTVTISAGGCPPVQKNVSVTVAPNPTVTVSPKDTVCPGQMGVVHAYGAASYLWPSSGMNTDSIISNPSVTTNYSVIGFNGSCSDTAIGTIEVIQLPMVEFMVNLPDNEPGNYLVTTEDYSGTIYNSYWTVNDTDIFIAPSLVYDFKEAGTYTICLYGENSVGCPSTYCKEILLKGDYTIYIPNAFSPNGDGKNDVFYCYGVNLKGFEMQIFDRWGEMVYKTDEITEGWRGDTKRSNTISKVDTYIYKVKVVDSELRKHAFQGQVHVIR
jgi:gliding motility-associated-like protein